MPTIEEMLVRIDATTASLNAELQKGTRSVDRFERNVNKKLSQVDGSFARLGTALAKRVLPLLGAQQLGRAVRSAVSDLANLADTADKLGITAEKLQEIRYAASEFGIATNTADMAMQRFIRRVGEAQNGGGELLSTLEQYNIALYDNEGNTRNVMDVLDDFADVIQNTSDSQERLRIAFKGFDSEGVDFVNALKDGSAGLKDLADRAHQMGAIVDEDMIDKAKEFDGVWNRMVLVAKSNWQSFTIESLSEFQKLASYLISETQAIQRAFVNMRASQGGGFTPLPDYTPVDFGDEYTSGSIEPFRKSLEDRMQTLADQSGGIEIEVAPVPPAIPDEKLKTHLQDRIKAQNDATQAAEDERDTILGVITALEFRNQQVKRNAREQDLYNQLKQAGVSLDSEEGQRIKVLVERYYDVSEAQEKATQRAEAFKDVMIDGFGDMASGADDFNDALKNIAFRLAELAATNVFEDLLNASTSSSSSGSSLFGGVGDFVGDLLGFAGGGDPPVGRPSIVGEQGPEIFVPKTSGTIIPNHALGGGVSVNQTINIDARGADDGFVRRWPAMKEELIRDTKAAVASEVARGGSYAKNIGKRR